jgi:hypothetical protein
MGGLEYGKTTEQRMEIIGSAMNGGHVRNKKQKMLMHGMIVRGPIGVRTSKKSQHKL